jgi:xanthine dehydrogenase YagT iron-sulfur-binding subunit
MAELSDRTTSFDNDTACWRSGLSAAIETIVELVGTCTVIIDGEAVYSCTTLAITCQGKTIETVEGFDTGPKGVPHAFHQHDGLMCGYCTPGFVTACKNFLDKNKGKEVTLEDVKKGLDGNICRCGTYIGVFEAALAAAKAMK